MKNSLNVISALLFIILPVSTGAQNSYNVKYGFEKGKSYYYTITSNQTGTQTVQGQEYSVISDSKLKPKMEITGFTEGIYSGNFVYDSFYSKSSAAGTEEILDDKAVAGKKTEYKFNSSGKKLERKDLGSDSPLPITVSTDMIIEFPDKPLNIGDKWTVEDFEKSNPKIQVKSVVEYKLEGTEKRNGVDCLKISLTGKSTSELIGESRGYEFVREGNGSSTGTAYFDLEKKLIVEMEIISDSKLMITIKNLNPSYPVVSKAKTTFVLTGK